MVDYSRFAKLIEQDEQDHAMDQAPRPVVTRLDKPTSITIPGRLAATSQEEEEEDDDNPPTKYHEDVIRAQQPPIPTFTPQTPKTRFTENGCDAGLFLWSQTADEVHLRVRVPLNTKARQVRVSLTNKQQLSISLVNHGAPIVQGQLANPVFGGGDGASMDVFSTEEERFHKAMEWEVQDLDSNSRCVFVRLTKHKPASQLVVWWSRVFLEGDEPLFDVSQANSARKTTPQDRQAMQHAWDEAQRLFKEAHQQQQQG
jgi:hypothetical protein